MFFRQPSLPFDHQGNSQPVTIQSNHWTMSESKQKNHIAKSKRFHLPLSPSEIRSRSPFWTTVKFPMAWLSLNTHPWWSLLSTGSLSYNTRIPYTVRILLLEQNILTRHFSMCREKKKHHHQPSQVFLFYTHCSAKNTLKRYFSSVKKKEFCLRIFIVVAIIPWNKNPNNAHLAYEEQHIMFSPVIMCSFI